MTERARLALRKMLPPFGEAVAAVGVAALVAAALGRWLSTADTAMLFLIPVLWVAVRRGLLPSLLTAIGAALTCNFLFFAPTFAFGFETVTDFATFFVFLLTAAVTGRWVGKATEQAAIIQAQAQERAKLNREIEEARALAEAERLRAALLSSVSHDLRTPLASIIGSTTTLLDPVATLSDQGRRDLAATILDAAEILNRYVVNLLDMTRLEAGAIEPRRDWVDVGDLIGAAAERLAKPLAGRRLDIAVPPDVPMLRLDFVMMEQVLVNLIDNAVKYGAPASPVAVRVTRDQTAVTIAIENEGAVVPPDDRQRLFDKFQRLNASSKVPGSGLGLSICRGFVEAHGGAIACAARADGRGMVFTVALPVAPVAPAIDMAATDA